jgi:hypothetical protein
MIKLLDILENKILVPLRVGERSKNYQIALQKKVQQYMKDGGKGDLDLRGTPITSLPSGLSVKGNLNLYGTPITSLPSGLSVGGGLDLSYCKKLTSLPSGLTVGGYLNLSGTPITSLPSDLSVGGYLDLYDTPLSKSHTKEQIKQMAPGVKGAIYM